MLRRITHREALPLQAVVAVQAALSDQGLVVDVIADLGKPDEVTLVFSGFQRFLYDERAV